MTSLPLESADMQREGGAVQTAIAAALRGLMRFPFMVASGWVAACVGVWLVTEPDVGWYPNEDTSFKVRLRGRATGELLPYNMHEPGISYEMANLVSRDCRNGKPKDPRNNSYRSGSKKGR